MRNLKVLIDDGREFSVRAASYRLRHSSEMGSGYTFYGEEDRMVCFVPTGRMVAIIEENSIAQRAESVELTTARRPHKNGRKAARRMSVA